MALAGSVSRATDKGRRSATRRLPLPAAEPLRSHGDSGALALALPGSALLPPLAASAGAAGYLLAVSGAVAWSPSMLVVVASLGATGLLMSLPARRLRRAATHFAGDTARLREVADHLDAE